MAWVKLDDQFFAHPKVIDLSKDAKLLFLAGLAHCAAQLTDGAISQGALRVIAATVDVDRAIAGELVNAGLWLTTSTGYMVHDYLDYNPTADQVKHERAATAQRVANWRQRHQDRDVSNAVTPAVSNAVSTPPPVPVPDPVPIYIPRERENAREASCEMSSTPTATGTPITDLSLSPVATQERAEAEPEPPIRDPKAEREAARSLYDSWCAAVEREPRTAPERKVWLGKLAEMARDVGLGPPGCAPLVARYRAQFGAEKRPTPGQVAAVYSQLEQETSRGTDQHGSPSRQQTTETRAEREQADATARYARIAAMAPELAAG